MRRSGIHRPTVEDIVEISGVEMLHPGGLAMTRRTGEVAALKPGMRLLDVSSGRGTMSVYYAERFGVDVTGIDISPSMVAAAGALARKSGLEDRVRFRPGDSQSLPFEDATFDAVVNECAVGIPDDSQAVLDEMVRVVKPRGLVVIHESTWKSFPPEGGKEDFAERYGTTPLELEEWLSMLRKAGLGDLKWECEEWSSPEMFWQVRPGRRIASPQGILSPLEKGRTFWRLWRNFGVKGLRKARENEKAFVRAVTEGRLGYCLFWGRRPPEGSPPGAQERRP